MSAQWFGKTPPDLSLEARAKGADWIYNYLNSFYLDPSAPGRLEQHGVPECLDAERAVGTAGLAERR